MTVTAERHTARVRRCAFCPVHVTVPDWWRLDTAICEHCKGTHGWR